MGFGALLCLVVGAGCQGTPLPLPVLEDACLLDEAGCVAGAYAGEDGILIIRGQGLFQGFDCDLGSDEPLPPSGAFAAWVGERPVEGLVPEVWRDGELEALRGYLGAGLRVGLHALRVRAPSGQQAELADAFRVANPLALDGAVADPYPILGGRLALSLRLQNLSRARLSEVRLAFSKSGDGDLALPGVQALDALGAQVGQRLDFEFPALREGRVDLRVFVQAVAGASVPIEAEALWRVQVTPP